MKARLVPLFFKDDRDDDFDIQLARLKKLLANEVEFLTPVPLGENIPDAEGVVLPQLLGPAYRQLGDFKAINIPILIITSEFGTMNMWDWEIASYLRYAGVDTIAPYNFEQTKMVCHSLGVKRELKESKFLVFQDNPGEGFQADIFKRFFWWEDEATKKMFDRFGVTLEKRSFKALGAEAQEISDSEAENVIENWEINIGDITPRALRSAIKFYIALKRHLQADSSIKAMGVNCLNEPRYSDSTPCLAWNMLHEEKKLIWGCEADTLSMITKYVIHKSLGVPIMMTNMYPFLMGQTALKHERIPNFPEVAGNSDNYVLVAHCGYLGVLPTSFATEWTLRPKVLAIVDSNATAIDARMPEGPITLAKIAPTMDKLIVTEGELEGYAEYPGSDCLTGGIIKISNGHKFTTSISSHHYLLMTGHNQTNIEIVAKLYGLEIEVI